MVQLGEILVSFYLGPLVRAQYLVCVGPSLADKVETRISSPYAGTDAFGGFNSIAQPAEQTEPSSHQGKRASSSDSIVPSKLEWLARLLPDLAPPNPVTVLQT